MLNATVGLKISLPNILGALILDTVMNTHRCLGKVWWYENQLVPGDVNEPMQDQQVAGISNQETFGGEVLDATCG
jgi:hypothetical protein